MIPGKEKSKKKKWFALKQRANGGEFVFIVVHLIDREPTCREILQVELIITEDIFIYRIP